MALNLTAIRKGVEKGIKINPTNILLLRENRVSDGYGGYYIDESTPSIQLDTIDILLNDGTSKRGNSAITDGGERVAISGVTAIILADPNYEIEVGDYFIHKSKRYTVTYPLDMYSVYWAVELEVKLNG